MNSLDEIYKDFGDGDFDHFYFRCNLHYLRGLFTQGTRVLELSTNIESTKILSQLAASVVTVDGSSEKIEKIKELGLPNVTAICSMFEDYTPLEKFDLIIMFRALEHLPNPTESLKHIKSFLEKDGILAVAVPNGTSLHRCIGSQLGMLPYPMHLTDADVRKGHYRVYNALTLNGVLKIAGFEPLQTWGSFLKMVSDRQMKDNPQIYTPEMMQALFRVSQLMRPEDCAELVTIVRHKE